MSHRARVAKARRHRPNRHRSRGGAVRRRGPSHTMRTTMKFELSEEEFDLLTMVLGYASGFARGRCNHELFARIMRLTNTIRAGDPHWTPYEITDPPGQHSSSD